MKCHDAEELIVQLVYDELTGEARDDLLKHMESCGNCRETFNDLKESSVILSDSFSDLAELRLTDEELVEILSVTPESEISDAPAVATEEAPVRTKSKRPFYFNSTFGIAATLLVTSFVLVIVYWSKMMGGTLSMAKMAVSESGEFLKDSKVYSAPSAPIEVMNFEGEAYTYADEEVEESLDQGAAVSGRYRQNRADGKKSVRKESQKESTWFGSLSVDGHVKSEKPSKSMNLTVTSGTETSPVDVSDDAPSTDDNSLVNSTVVNGTITTYTANDYDSNVAGKTQAMKPGNVVGGARGIKDPTSGVGVDYYLADKSKLKELPPPPKPKAPVSNVVPTDEKRQIMEGYLANKWKVGADRDEETKRISGESRKKNKANEPVVVSKDWAYKIDKSEVADKGSVRSLPSGALRLKEDSVQDYDAIKKYDAGNKPSVSGSIAVDKEKKEREELVKEAQKDVFAKQERWKRSRDSYESILLRDPANEEAIQGLRNVYAELRESAQKRRRAQEGERMSEIEWKWIDEIPEKDVAKAMEEADNTDPFANELIAKNGKDDDIDPNLPNIKLPHFVDQEEKTLEEQQKEILAKIEEQKKQEPMRESYFKPIPVNPFVMTSEDALSTFALDTDTAAYGIARNYINQGYLPPAGSVRTEEFVNAFDYNYSRNNANTFTVHAEAAPSPFGKGLVMLKVGVRGKVIGRDGRKASHLVFAVDTSGSMERQDRMPLLKKGLNTLLDNLDARDSISLIAYGRNSQLILDNTPMTQVDTIRKAVNDLQCGGSTNLHEGIQLAYRVAKQNFRSGGVNSVILCSDGMANIGDQTAGSMVNTADTYRKQGISFNSVGFGMGNYNDNILETMANKGDGSYVFIDSAKEAVSFFTDELGNRLNVIARDAKIQVKFDPRRVRRYRLLGYENRDIADKDFRNDSVDAGEVGSGQSATAIYEVELLNEAEIRDLGTVFIRYQNTSTNKVEEINSRLRADMIRERTPADSPRFFLAAAVTEFAEILRESDYAKDGSLDAVQRIAEQVAIQLPLDDKVQEFRYLVNKAKGLPRAK